MSERLLTRREVVEVVNAELGIPITMSTVEKSAMVGAGPKAAAKYGKSFLYEKETALEWARGLIDPVAA